MVLTSQRAPKDRPRPREGGVGELYERHIGGAVGLAYLLTRDHGEAEDLAHDAFIRLLGRFRHLRERAAFGAYLRRTIVNLHLSRLRRLRIERSHRSRATETASDRSGDIDVRTDLWAALGTLPPRQRAALVLRYYEDLSEQDTADVLRCSIAAVKSLTARGTESLRRALNEESFHG